MGSGHMSAPNVAAAASALNTRGRNRIAGTAEAAHSASMKFGGQTAESAGKVANFASMILRAQSAPSAEVGASASMKFCAQSAPSVGEGVCANIKFSDQIAPSAGGRFASTAKSDISAPIVKTCPAPPKGAHCSATSSAAPKHCANTCARSTAANRRR